MKIQGIAVLRWNSDTEEPVLLDSAYNVAEYNFFMRGSVKDFLSFAFKTVMKRVGAGTQGVDYEGNMVYCFVQGDGLGCIVITDKEYAARVAITLAKEMIADFLALHSATWRSQKVDGSCKLPRLETALVEYQDPAKVDKVMKLHTQLKDTKEILCKTIDKVLERGEKLDDLVDRSSALSQQSKLFYKQARKTNSCCSVM